MTGRIIAPVQGAEAPRVTKTQGFARIEVDIDVIVYASRRAAIDNRDAARHAEMHDRGAFGGIDQQVLRAPLD